MSEWETISGPSNNDGWETITPGKKLAYAPNDPSRPESSMTREATPIDQIRASIPGRIMQGIADPGLGILQLLSKIPGADPMEKLRAQQQAAYKFHGVDAPEGVLPRSIDQQVRDNEASYQEARQKTASKDITSLVTGKSDPGFDFARLAGNIASPTNLLAASKIPQAATLMGRAGYGALSGAAAGAAQPVTSGGDYWDEKTKQTALGAATGGAMPIAAGSVARLLRPNTRPAVQALINEGITPTPGQILGGAWQRVEEGLTSVPVLGDAIKASQRRAAQELDVAAFNRALSPIGEKLPKGLEGREAVEYVGNKLSSKYDALLPNLKIKGDAIFNKDVATLRGMVQNGAIGPAEAAQFEKILNNQVLGKFQGQNSLSGETMKDIEHDLGYLSSKFQRDPSSDKQLLGDALQELQDNMRSLVERNNPAHSAELKKIHTGWANFKRVQRAASLLGADEGTFSAAQLQNAVKATDRSKDKAQFAKGNALMQDLSESAKTVLGSKVPDSGTPFRIMNAAALGGGYAINPAIPAAVVGASALYTTPAQKLAAALLAKRPDIFTSLARGTRAAGRYLTPGSAALANQLSQPPPE